MPRLLRMPEVAAGAAEAVLAEWIVAERAEFAAADTLATVETDKAMVDVEAEDAGVVLKTLVGQHRTEVGHHLTGLAEHRDGRAHLDVRARRDQRLEHHPGVLGLDVHHRLVGLHRGQCVRGGELAAFGHQPFRQHGLGRAGGHLGHAQQPGHVSTSRSRPARR